MLILKNGTQVIINKQAKKITSPIVPGEKVFFEIDPYMAEDTMLSAYLQFDDTEGTYGLVNITYLPEKKFKLVCKNNPDQDTHTLPYFSHVRPSQ